MNEIIYQQPTNNGQSEASLKNRIVDMPQKKLSR